MASTPSVDLIQHQQDIAPTAEFLRHLLACEGDLRAFIGSLVADRMARQDVYQEVVLLLWQNYARYDGERPFGAWARQFALNKVRHEWRRQSRVTTLSEGAMTAVAEAFGHVGPQREADAELYSQEERAALEACVQGLPPRTAQLINQRYTEGRTVEDMAEALSMKTMAVYQALNRARLALADCVNRKLGGSAAS